MKELTDLRNSYFHGEGRKVESSVGHISRRDAYVYLRKGNGLYCGECT